MNTFVPTVNAEVIDNGNQTERRVTPHELGLISFLLVLIVRPTEFLPLLHHFRPAMLTFTATLGFWILAGRKTKFFTHNTNKFAIGLLIAMVCSIPFSYWARPSYEITIVYLKQITLFTLITNMMIGIQAISRLLGALVLAVTFHAVMIIKTYLAGNLLLGRSFGVSGGIFGDPNDLALAFVMMLPIALWFLGRSRDWMTRFFWAVPLLAFLGGIIATQSRGGLLGTIFVGALIVKDSRKQVVGCVSPIPSVTGCDRRCSV